MAPSRKRKSDEMAGPTTPEASGMPAPKKMRITQTQKQALIDNLQLEVTERARHLRAHYALQCADLKSRIERRINRIPVAMRTMTMSELMEKHNPAPNRPRTSPAKPITVIKTQPVPAVSITAATTTTSAVSRPTRKRKSSIVIAADPFPESSTENAEEITVKTRPAPLPKPRATKRGSRNGKAGGVLSPRSHNSRTLPRSPIKSTTAVASGTTDYRPVQPSSPQKQFQQTTRPVSPLKPISPLKTAALATTSAITSSMHNILATAKTATRSKAAINSRPNEPQRTISQSSNHSATSNVTATSTGTVVKNMARAVRGRATAAAKRTAAKVKEAPSASEKATTTGTARGRAGAARKVATTTAGVKKPAATAGTMAEPTTGRRTLRKRN